LLDRNMSPVICLTFCLILNLVLFKI
jgi:hypothetical protein